jgi:glycosyltransferase involved in cell wall biosynthesis
MSGNPKALPKVSIGFPVYNGERYVRNALDSLLGQTFTDFELVISDNASTDGTGAICLEYAARDPRIRYLRQSQNCGAAANFQFVLDEARCEYFMWASADDRWDSGWLEALVGHLVPGVSIAFGSSMGFLENGQMEKRITFKSLKGSRMLRMLRFYLWNEYGQKANIIYGLFRTTELRKGVAEVFSQGDENRVGFDIILVFTMLRAGGLHTEPGVTLYKRSKFGVIRFRPGKVLTWRRAAEFLLYLSKLDLVPYLLEHARRAPSGLTRCTVLVTMPFKYGLMVFGGLGPAASVLVRRMKHKRPIAVET